MQLTPKDRTFLNISIDHFHQWRLICHSSVFVLIGPTLLHLGLNILLNFAHGSEVGKAYKHSNTRMLNLITIMTEVFHITNKDLPFISSVFLI